jgi:hypothetical protein
MPHQRSNEKRFIAAPRSCRRAGHQVDEDVFQARVRGSMRLAVPASRGAARPRARRRPAGDVQRRSERRDLLDARAVLQPRGDAGESPPEPPRS